MGDYRRHRGIGAKGGNLTPEEAGRRLAVPILAVIQKKAQVEFVGTNLAGYSKLVRIASTQSSCVYDPGIRAGYPVYVNGTQWERAIVPVLSDERFSGSGFGLLLNLNEQAAVDVIAQALIQSFHEAGYGPIP
jgi:hypothetical protein